MDYLPLFCDLRARPTLVVGGGEVALRKARLLARCGAIVHVVAPAVDDELRALVRDSGDRVSTAAAQAKLFAAKVCNFAITSGC